MSTPEKLSEWLVKWWHGSDTGMSSKYIAAVFSGIPAMRQIAEVAAPWDTSDVGRCIRLLDLATARREPAHSPSPPAERLAGYPSHSARIRQCVSVQAWIAATSPHTS